MIEGLLGALMGVLWGIMLWVLLENLLEGVCLEGPVLLKLSFAGLMKCFVRVLLSGQWSASVKQCFFL